jgi:hypothetical protein
VSLFRRPNICFPSEVLIDLCSLNFRLESKYIPSQRISLLGANTVLSRSVISIESFFEVEKCISSVLSMSKLIQYSVPKSTSFVTSLSKIFIFVLKLFEAAIKLMSSI